MSANIEKQMKPISIMPRITKKSHIFSNQRITERENGERTLDVQKVTEI